MLLISLVYVSLAMSMADPPRAAIELCPYYGASSIDPAEPAAGLLRGNRLSIALSSSYVK